MRCCVAVGQRLDRYVRSSDVVGRLGGDRFGVILSQCREEMVVHAMDRIIDGIREEPVEIDGQSIPVSVLDRLRAVPRPGQHRL